MSSPPTETRGPIIQKVRRHGTSPLRLLVGVRFQVSFTPLVGVLFTFPSRYSCTIGRQGVFRLGGWSPHVQTGFHVPRPTRGSNAKLRLRGCHPLRRTFPDPLASWHWTTGLLRVRSPLLAESHLMSFPPGTEMFQFPGFASPAYGFSGRSPRREGFPHSDIRGSTIARISPRLFAACHVLHRLLAPRHPPNALFTLRIATATARTQDRTAPNRGHAPSRMRGCGSRTIRARSHSHSQNYTTNSGFTCKRTKALPAHDAGKACLLEAVPDGRMDKATHPIRVHPDARRHRTPAPRALGAAAWARYRGIESGERSPSRTSVIVRTDRNRGASRHPMSRSHP